MLYYWKLNDKACLISPPYSIQTWPPASQPSMAHRSPLLRQTKTGFRSSCALLVTKEKKVFLSSSKWQRNSQRNQRIRQRKYRLRQRTAKKKSDWHANNANKDRKANPSYNLQRAGIQAKDDRIGIKKPTEAAWIQRHISLS